MVELQPYIRTTVFSGATAYHLDYGPWWGYTAQYLDSLSTSVI